MNETEESFSRSAPRSATTHGQLAVGAMLAIAVFMATFAWWWNFNRGRQALDFYGPEGAILVRTAPTVEYLRPDGFAGQRVLVRMSVSVRPRFAARFRFAA